MFFCGGKRTKNARGFRFPRTPKTTAPRGGSSLWGRCALRRRREERGGMKVFARLSRALWVFKRRRGFGAEPRTALRTHEICGFCQAKRRRKPHSSAVLFRSEPLREPEKNILFFARKFWAGGKAQSALGEPFFKKGLPRFLERKLGKEL